MKRRRRLLLCALLEAVGYEVSALAEYYGHYVNEKEVGMCVPF